MGRFCSLLTIFSSKIFGITIIGILVFSLPSRAQEPSSTDTPSQVRVPPPPANADPVELEQQGDQYRAQKAYLDSIDYYRAAMKTADSAILHNKVGMCLLQLRRDSEAKKEFQRAIKENKDYAEAYNNLGALYYNLRKYGAAIREYKKAIKLNDDSASFHSNLGGAYFHKRILIAPPANISGQFKLIPIFFSASRQHRPFPFASWDRMISATSIM